ncbi:hypothetical protein K435DRAFT_712514 [Dendrothele bispora CBS 962.96]|uniref:DUF202 domain-containing protein n=1 Tax=Dendrothele bispora (strain CBS 962.96) TaxID=1314807 RepID=A0A4S8MRT3_DENBC|nr:hypothetical protein K435DRAFT_712514 [Dendrothele bispora CBS 962.96]
MDRVKYLLVENTASNARDFCMLERNFLSHFRLALLFMLLFSSVLLHARLLDPESTERGIANSLSGYPLASVQFLGSLVAIAGGLWEYNNGYKDLMDMRAFLVGTKPHLAMMTAVVGVVLTTCIVLLADEDRL